MINHQTSFAFSFLALRQKAKAYYFSHRLLIFFSKYFHFSFRDNYNWLWKLSCIGQFMNASFWVDRVLTEISDDNFIIKNPNMKRATWLCFSLLVFLVSKRIKFFFAKLKNSLRNERVKPTLFRCVVELSIFNLSLKRAKK